MTKNTDFQDDFEFKAINRGLGFHQKTKTPPSIEKKLERQQEEMPTTPSFLHSPSLGVGASQLSQKNAPSKGPSLGLSSQLAHTNSSLSNTNLNQLSKSELFDKTISSEESFTRIRLYERFFSWMIDTLFVLVLFLISMITIFYFSRLEFNDPFQFLEREFFMGIYIPFFIGFYFLYFFIFEGFAGQTIGKMLTGLKLVQLKSPKGEDERITFYQSLARTLFNIIGIPLLGLLSIYNVSNSLSGVKIVKLKD